MRERQRFRDRFRLRLAQLRLASRERGWDPAREAARIAVEQCTVWNDWGYALGVSYETRAPIHSVSFRDCDILFVRHWALGIHVVDSATIRDVRFEDIRVEDLALPARRFGHEPKLMRVAVAWTDDGPRLSPERRAAPADHG